MTTLLDWFDGRTLLLLVGFVALEALWFLWRWRVGASRLRPAEILWNLASGAALMAAVGLALEGEREAVAACLLLALFAHLLDLRARLKAA